ncbi:MAG TPA: carboxypeptidase regulatory-like domain-containing protein [Terracidiphilus sp.]|nr:carboxypeptidase regulatory-like domain-containing protein [Terracidiphilus sp.]
MRSMRFFFAMALLSAAAFAHAVQVTGTVTDKTTNKPAAGDPVVILDVQAGMAEAAHATTDAKGHYTLSAPGNGPYLVRVTHQGAGYFIAAPQGGGPGDIPVYDVAAKVQGVFIEADVIEAETDPSGQLKVNERYFVHNTSSPPTTQWSPKSFEIILPSDAIVMDTGAQRPSGLPTSVKMDPDGPKGHYSFNFPIQPDEGEKDTIFQISYSLPYSGQKYTFKPSVTLPADNVAILLPKSMTFTPGAGINFKTVNEDPSIQTFLLKNALPGSAITFTISGEGQIPREAQGGQQADNGQSGAAGPGTQPGGGIGEPINTPDPLSKYKWWILGGLALLLAAAAAFLLRRPPGAPVSTAAGSAPQPAIAPTAAPAYASSATSSVTPSPASHAATLLAVLKEELFAVESEKIAGTLSAADYAEQKSALEVVLKRALKKQ